MVNVASKGYPCAIPDPCAMRTRLLADSLSELIRYCKPKYTDIGITKPNIDWL